MARDLHASILFYSLGREKSYLWVVRASDIQLITLPSEAVTAESGAVVGRSPNLAMTTQSGGLLSGVKRWFAAVCQWW